MNNQAMLLNAISPIDGRYGNKTAALQAYFSEFALIKYRVKVEVEYILALSQLSIQNGPVISKDLAQFLGQLVENFSLEDAWAIKEIELTTNHDVKAVEYFLKQKISAFEPAFNVEMIHFGLTSQDINNTAFPLMTKGAIETVIIPMYRDVIEKLLAMVNEYADVPMLARTHGQPASPTTLGKEIMVYVERLAAQLNCLEGCRYSAKFGGATGNFNAHKVAYPAVNWPAFADQFLAKLGLVRQQFTTQIEHYDDFASTMHQMMRINTILLDLCKDMWTYISMDYFKQKTVANEIGSSAMPHKVNPIDFENAEGNLGIANALFSHLASKLPISRLQRDLTDSTVLRNEGVPFAHSLISVQSILKGLGKLELNTTKLHDDLEANWAVVAEAIQTILRREQYPNPYEALKTLTRGKQGIDKESIQQFIKNLDVSTALKEELMKISPQNYTGYGLEL